MDYTIGGQNNYEFEMGSTNGDYDEIADSKKTPRKYQLANQAVLAHNEANMIAKSSAKGQQVKIVWGGQIMCTIACFNLVLLLTSSASLILGIYLVYGQVGNAENACASSLNDLKKELDELKRSMSSSSSGKVVNANSDKVDGLSAIWTAVNASKEKLDSINETVQELYYESNNLIEGWLLVNSSAKKLDNIPFLWSAVNKSREELNDIRTKVVKLENEVNNKSYIPGPRGPPGYNGTQGPIGIPGSPGPPGSSGNLTLCVYKKVRSPGIQQGQYKKQEVNATETADQKFLGVNCDTNDARVCRLSSTADPSGRRTYTCKCENTLGTGESTMYCYLHYWQCTITT